MPVIDISLLHFLALLVLLFFQRRSLQRLLKHFWVTGQQRRLRHWKPPLSLKGSGADPLREVVLPPALTHACMMGRLGSSELSNTTYLANVSAYSALEPGTLALALAADNWTVDSTARLLPRPPRA